MHLSISNDIVSTKIYDKNDGFDFEIVNLPFLDGDVPRSTFYEVFISQLIRLARTSSHVADLYYLCLVFVMFSRLFIAALRSPAGKGLTSWLLFVMFNCVFVTFPCGILGQVWYLIVSIPNIFAAFLTSTADNSQMQLQNYLPY